MKKKGFTLIELLAVIVIIAIILNIAVPTISNIMYDVRLSSFIANEKTMIWSVKNYLGSNNNSLPVNIGETTEIRLSQLQAEGLISSIQDPWNSSDTCDGYILVTKIGIDKFDYTPYLKCEVNNRVGDYTSDNLVAVWKLNDNAYDYTPGSSQGVIQNSMTTTNRFGVPNTALSFNGPSNFVDTNYDYSLNNSGGTTISLWVKFVINDTDGKIKNIFGKNSWEYLLSQIDEKIKFTQWDSSGEYAIELTSNTNIEVGKWYNIVLVYNNLDQQVYLYINGLLDVSGHTIGSVFADKKESLKIGRGYPDIGAASSTFFVGSIDNICVYNRVWTAAEVKLNYDIDLYRDL